MDVWMDGWMDLIWGKGSSSWEFPPQFIYLYTESYRFICPVVLFLPATYVVGCLMGFFVVSTSALFWCCKPLSLMIWCWVFVLVLSWLVLCFPQSLLGFLKPHKIDFCYLFVVHHMKGLLFLQYITVYHIMLPSPSFQNDSLYLHVLIQSVKWFGQEDRGV